MIFYLLIIFAVCLVNIKLSFIGKGKALTNENRIFTDYTSIENTACIKGLFILIVILSHISKELTLGDSIFNTLYFKINWLVISQSVVCMFLFYSGYGVMLSALKKGRDYVKKIPKNRVLKTLFNFDIAVLVFLLVQICFGKGYSIREILLSFIGFENFGNESWYIFIILVLYLISYVAFLIGKENKVVILGVTFVLTLGLCALMWKLKNGESWWWETNLVYPLGMLYYCIEDKVKKLLGNNYVYLACLGLAVVLMAACIWKRSIPPVLALKHITFTVVVVLLTMKVQINNKLLLFVGQNLFPFYILHKLPMIVLSHFGVNSINVAYIVLAMGCTFLLVFPYKYVIEKLDNLLFSKK